MLMVMNSSGSAAVSNHSFRYCFPVCRLRVNHSQSVELKLVI